MNMLRNLRERAGLSQFELSKLLDVTQSTVSMWETGVTFPRRKMLVKLSTVFNCSMYEFIKDCETKNVFK